ncbi:MAG: M1 family metallopeptidase [Bacteroidales bacterium]|nr:M1 family metallopeptidase [Bacteroidales bacterium]
MKNNIFIVAIFILLSSCFIKKDIVEKEKSSEKTVIELEANYSQNINIKSYEALITNYKASNTIINDLIHTKLKLSFNYKTKQISGNAEITLKPHYYKTDTLTLDAQQFDIHNISIEKNNEYKELDYKYNNSKIYIQLDKTYNKNEKYTISINYTANPERINKKGSWAITDNKGLYFIDTDTENPQIWTQGETQSNSAWFPTIDSPNQKMTQEIFLTVKKEFKTLSNGKLTGSLPNSDGTRTDYWEQNKPHAPYLAMIAVGNFNIIKDYWRDLPVDVYIEEGDETKAKGLFEKTYKMIEFYSRKLDYDYPWNKYSQIVVRNFVSGAMENTGAVVFGDYVLDYYNEEQRIEYECVVAHELSHHWFGDLVTCESWANLPLNESFATYFEYLWLEHEYGRNVADAHLEDDYSSYNFERLFKDENLIRFYNKHRDNMFDAHSYQKGGLILHMLRYTVGEDAFWDALELYLKNNEYKAVEIHHLRLAFEEITGQDLNWFFNQWFLNKGIPELKITYSFDNNTNKTNIKIEQIQNLNKTPLYKIPTYIDFYFKNKTIRKKILIDEQTENFSFYFEEKPLAVNFDPENSILCNKKENYTIEEYITILDKAPLYQDKNEAFNKLKTYKSLKLDNIYITLLKHPYYKFKYFALSALNKSGNENWTENMKTEYKNLLSKLSEDNEYSRIKSLASKILKNY